VSGCSSDHVSILNEPVSPLLYPVHDGDADDDDSGDSDGDSDDNKVVMMSMLMRPNINLVLMAMVMAMVVVVVVVVVIQMALVVLVVMLKLKMIILVVMSIVMTNGRDGVNADDDDDGVANEKKSDHNEVPASVESDDVDDDDHNVHTGDRDTTGIDRCNALTLTTPNSGHDDDESSQDFGLSMRDVVRIVNGHTLDLNSINVTSLGEKHKMSRDHSDLKFMDTTYEMSLEGAFICFFNVNAHLLSQIL
jgi:hypothetical protein